MPAADIIRNELRDRLMRFINRRERAYKEIRKKNLPVADYKKKLDAMERLRVQLVASTGWSLRSHIMWICAMRADIVTLLPYEFHDDPKQVTYRKHISDMISWCDDQLETEQQKLFKPLSI